MLKADNTVIIAVDIQEKLVNMLQNSEKIATNCTKLLKAAHILNIKTILTEQYPKGLGSTINPIKEINNFKTIEKTTFSALATEEFEQYFLSLNKKNVVIFGIETHICVYQTVLGLINKKCNVYVINDCCASRNDFNHNTALDSMKQEGAKVISLEMLLFMFLESSKHPNFKEIQGLIK